MIDNNKCIFIVDDVLENLEVLCDLLEQQQGTRIITAQSGAEALEKIPIENPDLVLLDIFMSEMNGYEVCKKLKADKRTAHIPVIFLSAGTEIENRLEGFSVGAVDYVTKPFNLMELNARINTHVELKKAKQKLEADEKLFRKIIDNQGEGFGITDVEEKFLFVNPAAERIFGVSKNTLVGKNLKEFFDEKQFKKIRQETKKRIVGKESSYELTIIRPDKRKVELLVTATPDFDINNNFRGTIAIFRDITVQKKAEETLKNINQISEERIKKSTKQLSESEQKFRNLIETSHDLIFTIDLKGQFTYINPAWEEIFEYQSSEILGHCIDNFLLEQEELISKLFLQNILVDKKIYNYETELLTKSGKIVILRFNVIGVKNNKGEIVGVQGTAYDITKYKKAEKEIKKLNTAIEQSANIVIVTNFDGVVEYANKRFSEVTGYTNEEIIVKTPGILKSGMQSTKFYHDMWMKIKSKQEWYGEFQNKKKNGELYWESAIITPILDISGNIVNFIGVKEDITERKLYEKRMLSAIIEAEETERKRFAEDLHDELGPYLSGIKLFISQFRKEKLSLTQRLQLTENIDEMIDESIAKTKLISNILMPNILMDFGYIKALESFINKINYAQKLNIEFIKPKAVKEINSINEIVMYRIIIELINNSLKHSNCDKIKIAILHKKSINIKYQDNGIGFNLEDTIEEKRGNGLINILNRLKSINAQYTFNSYQGKGIEFTFEVPIN